MFFTIDDVTSRMLNHENRVILQNDANESSDYEPDIFSNVEEFRGSDLYNRIADYEVTDMYSEKDGTVWICYECDVF